MNRHAKLGRRIEQLLVDQDAIVRLTKADDEWFANISVPDGVAPRTYRGGCFAPSLLQALDTALQSALAQIEKGNE